MIDPVTLQRWFNAGLFVLVAALVIFVRMLPLSDSPGGMPPPDLILLIGFAWVLRRPDFVPALLFAAVLLLVDLLFLRPPGLAVALAVAGLEFLRGRVNLLREQAFSIEWLTVAGVLIAVALGERIVYAVFFVPQIALESALAGLVINILAYPLVVGVSVWALGVRRLAPGEHAAEAGLV